MRTKSLRGKMKLIQVSSTFPRYCPYFHFNIKVLGFHRYSWIFLEDYSSRSQRAVCTDDFILVTDLSLGPAKAGALAIPSSLNVTGGEYKSQERIHRHVADWRLLAIPAS